LVDGSKHDSQNKDFPSIRRWLESRVTGGKTYADWGNRSNGTNGGDVAIGLVVSRGLPEAVASGSAVRGGVSIFSRINPLVIVAALLTPNVAGGPGDEIGNRPAIRIREGYAIPENADPDHVAEFFRLRDSDPRRARQILREIWEGSDIRHAFPPAVYFPRGFKNQAQFGQAMAELRAALRNSGVTDGVVGVRGSSVTGISSNRNSPSYGQPFGPGSDIDVFVQSSQLSGQYKGDPDFVHPGNLLRDYPELRAWSRKWTIELGRDITPAAWKLGALPNTPALIPPK
jgi:hypothetical protein